MLWTKLADVEATSAREVPRPAAQVFYRYEDPNGRLVIVDSLSKVPIAAREHVERVRLGGGSDQSGLQGSLNVVEAPTVARAPVGEASSVARAPFGPALPKSFDAASFGAGFGVGVIVVASVMFFFGRSGGGVLRRLVFGGALVVGLGALASGAYFGWLRRTAGQGDGAFATPADLVQDARSAVDGVNQRRAQQEQLLEEIDKLAK